MYKWRVGVPVGLLLVLSVWIWYSWPKPIHTTLNGIKYQLGEEHVSWSKPVQLEINGEIRHRLTRPPLFTGKIYADPDIPVEMDMEDLEIPLSRSGMNQIELIKIENGSVNRTAIGVLYSNSSFSELTITLYQESPSGASGWSGEDGFMLTAPAGSRPEALEMSNELMNEDLAGYKLK